MMLGQCWSNILHTKVNFDSVLGRATCELCRTHWAKVGSMFDQYVIRKLAIHWADEQNYIGPTSFANIGQM